MSVTTVPKPAASTIPSPVPESEPRVDDPAPTNPSARPPSAGPCRAPHEPGCERCCTLEKHGACTELSFSGSGSAKVVPWYNASASLTACPAGCPPCARCLERDEQELRGLKQPAGCDCRTQKPGIDPCFTPKSCGCYCSRFEELSKACPELE